MALTRRNTMKYVIPYIKAATFDEALAISAEVTGKEFYAGYENHYEPQRFTSEALNNDKGFWVSKETGDVYYIYKNVTKDGRYGAGEQLFHKLSIHTALSSGSFSAVFIMEEIEDSTMFSDEITIIPKDWDRCIENRKHFAEMNMIVTTL
jgi:hypothetical protein